MTQAKESLLKDEENRSETAAKKNVNCDNINSKNLEEELNDEKGEDSSRRMVLMGDGEGEGEEDQELSDYEEAGSADDLEEATEIPDELNRRAMEILALLQKKEEDPEQKDEDIVARLQELEEQRVKILQEEYPYSFTQWVEKKWETPPQEKEKRRRREELWKKKLEKEEEERKKAKVFRKQRKFLEKECARAKERMQSGANKGDKDVTEEEGEGHRARKEKMESKGGNRKQVEEEEKRRSKRKEKHYRRVEEVKVTVKEGERVTRGMDQKRKTEEVKNQSKVERERLQKAVEEEAKSEKREEKKINILKLEIKQKKKKKKDTTKLDAEEGREPLMMKEEKKERKVERKREKDGALREATQKRTRQGAGGGRRRDGEGRRRNHEVPPQQVSRRQKQATSRDRSSEMDRATEKDSRPSALLRLGNRTAAGRERHHRHSPAGKSRCQQMLVDDLSLAYHAALSGKYVAMLPTVMLNDSELVTLQVAGLKPRTRIMYAYYMGRRYAHSQIKKVVEYIKLRHQQHTL